MSIATATVGVFDITFDEINKLWTASRDGKIECTSNDPHGLIEPLAPVLAKAAFESKLSEIKLEIHELLDRAVKAIDLLDKRVAYWVGPGYASAPKLPLIIGITDEGRRSML